VRTIAGSAPCASLGAAASLLAFAVLLPGTASAQGLGAAAAREKARRDTVKSPPARVFTDDDLPGAPGGETAGEASGDEDTEAEPLSAEEPVDPVREELDRERERRAEQERQWRARFAEARARVEEAEARCWQEVVRTEFYNGIPVQMKVQEFVESEEFRQAKQALADLREEFRRTGLPPGWARE
jgi:hypothetical protein